MKESKNSAARKRVMRSGSRDTCRRRAEIKMKDSTSIYVALASSKREINLLAEARWCCKRIRWGEEQLQQQESRGDRCALRALKKYDDDDDLSKPNQVSKVLDPCLGPLESRRDPTVVQLLVYGVLFNC